MVFYFCRTQFLRNEYPNYVYHPNVLNCSISLHYAGNLKYMAFKSLPSLMACRIHALIIRVMEINPLLLLDIIGAWCSCFYLVLANRESGPLLWQVFWWLVKGFCARISVISNSICAVRPIANEMIRWSCTQAKYKENILILRYLRVCLLP